MLLHTYFGQSHLFWCYDIQLTTMCILGCCLGYMNITDLSICLLFLSHWILIMNSRNFDIIEDLHLFQIRYTLVGCLVEFYQLLHGIILCSVEQLYSLLYEWKEWRRILRRKKEWWMKWGWLQKEIIPLLIKTDLLSS